ncbi:MAG: methyltransferase domain-containing protein [Pseudomonadota bacterium]
MSLEDAVAGHYTTGGLLDRIASALRSVGVEPTAATPDDLKPVDEFHIGGVAATRDLIAQLDITFGDAVLDIGSGLGGTSRHVAATTGAHVTGLDLTPEFVETATALSIMVGMAGRTEFQQGSAVEMPFGDGTFDAALLLHVGMNIPDKVRLLAEAARVLRPGGTFAVYDVMKTGDQPIDFPVPWAEVPENSFLADLDCYRDAAQAAGFREVAARDRSEIALQFFADQRARLEADGPPALGIHLMMGETRGLKVKNMVANIKSRRIAPTELILQKAG